MPVRGTDERRLMLTEMRFVGWTASYTLFSNKIYEDIIQELQTSLIIGYKRRRRKNMSEE
jgi:predicted glycosyltransferase